MSYRDVTLYLRRANSVLLAGAFTLGVSTLLATGAGAQTSGAQTSHEFSSSTDAAASSSADPAGLPLAPAPAPGPGTGAGQAENTYGRRNRGMLSHLTIEAGGGANGPVSDSSNYITWGGNFTVGGGYRVTPRLSVLAEYQFIDDKLPGVIIGETGANGGNAHIWSLTLDPVFDLFPRHANSIYVTGGGGFYRKVTNFTDPQQYEYCTYYYCGIGVQNTVVGHFSSNQGGWNIGAGYTRKLGGISGDGKLKLFAEARYLDVLTPAVTSSPNGLGTTTLGADTKLVPITLGIRY